jgi:hypothetical protein
MASGLCLVLITQWYKLDIQSWAPLPELLDKKWPGFYEKRLALFACPPTIQNDLGGSFSDGSAQRRWENSWHSVVELQHVKKGINKTKTTDCCSYISLHFEFHDSLMVAHKLL